MKVGFISDLHLEHRETGFGVPVGHFHVWGSVCFPEALDADVLVLAGDIHHRADVRDWVKKTAEDRYQIPVVMPLGNHDYWKGSWVDEPEFDVINIGDKRLAATTLWTALPYYAFGVSRDFSDFRFIKGTTIDRWNETHARALSMLLASDADVIATHHAPSGQSIAPRFAHEAQNIFFANTIDLRRFPRCKLWIHGHMHDEFDYIEDDVRVVCNPLGYPNEHKRKVGIKVIEI